MELREANGIFLFTPYKRIFAWAFIVFGVDRLAIKMGDLGDENACFGGDIEQKYRYKYWYCQTKANFLV